MERYYAFIQNYEIIGIGQIQVIDENIKNIPISKDVYSEMLKDRDKYIWYLGSIIKNPNYEQLLKDREKERIMALSMTPLDFLKAIEKYAGITYSQIKELCDSNPEVDRELRFCQNIYRNNELLIGLASQFDVSEEQLDAIFDTVDKIKNGIITTDVERQVDEVIEEKEPPAEEEKHVIEEEPPAEEEQESATKEVDNDNDNNEESEVQ